MKNNRQSFIELMALEAVEPPSASKTMIYRSLAPAYSPGNTGSAYGGHPFAQAAWAAAQTVDSGFVLHSVTGHFLLQCDATITITYEIRNLRNGKGYCTRAVDASQRGRVDVCFSCICSFKRPERHLEGVRIAQKVDIKEMYGEQIVEKRPEEWPEAPSVDSPWYWELVATQEGQTNDFPGLDMRKVNMSDYNSRKSPVDRRQLQYYSILGSLPPFDENPNIHACAHMYASDRNGLFIIPNHTGAENGYSQMTSLSHTVILQSIAASDIGMLDRQGRPRWFCQELRMDGVDDGRGLVTSQMWADGGHVVASTMQDGLLRFTDEGMKLVRLGAIKGDSRKSKL